MSDTDRCTPDSGYNDHIPLSPDEKYFLSTEEDEEPLDVESVKDELLWLKPCSICDHVFDSNADFIAHGRIHFSESSNDEPIQDGCGQTSIIQSQEPTAIQQAPQQQQQISIQQVPQPQQLTSNQQLLPQQQPSIQQLPQHQTLIQQQTSPLPVLNTPPPTPNPTTPSGYGYPPSHHHPYNYPTPSYFYYPPTAGPTELWPPYGFPPQYNHGGNHYPQPNPQFSLPPQPPPPYPPSSQKPQEVIKLKCPRNCQCTKCAASTVKTANKKPKAEKSKTKGSRRKKAEEKEVLDEETLKKLAALEWEKQHGHWCRVCNKRFGSQDKLVDHLSYDDDHRAKQDQKS